MKDISNQYDPNNLGSAAFTLLLLLLLSSSV
jgi:hypothetical protein